MFLMLKSFQIYSVLVVANNEYDSRTVHIQCTKYVSESLELYQIEFRIARSVYSQYRVGNVITLKGVRGILSILGLVKNIPKKDLSY